MQRCHCWLLLWIYAGNPLACYTHELGSENLTEKLKFEAATEWEQEQEQEELHIDQRPPPTDEERREYIKQELPALPLDFMERSTHHNLQLNDSCAPFPKFLELEFHNNYWQVHRSGELSFYLYGAYYDNRTTVVSREGVKLVRILAMVNEIDLKYEDFPPSYCQLWYEEFDKPRIVPVRNYREIWYSAWCKGPNLFYATWVECPLHEEEDEEEEKAEEEEKEKEKEGEEGRRDLVPKAVSLVASPCARATNSLRVIYEPAASTDGQRSGFAVCSTGLYNPYRDNSVRLVEWLELLRLLGAEHVFLPTYGIHPNATKVLRYYEREGFVSAPDISLVRGEPALPHFTHEVIKRDSCNHIVNEIIPLNDCLCRNMYKYDYVAVFDIDEIIMPLGELRNWRDLAHHAAEDVRADNCDEGASSLCFCNVYYPAYPERKPYSTDAPTYMYMLQHVARVAEHLEPFMATKCFHNTQLVTSLHNHYALDWVASCGMRSVNVTLGQMQHYREPDIAETLENPVIDDVIWRYKEPLVARTQAILRKLGLLRRVQVGGSERNSQETAETQGDSPKSVKEDEIKKESPDVEELLEEISVENLETASLGGEKEAVAESEVMPQTLEMVAIKDNLAVRSEL